MEEVRKVSCSALWLLLENSVCDDVTSPTGAVGKHPVGFPEPVDKGANFEFKLVSSKEQSCLFSKGLANFSSKEPQNSHLSQSAS